GHLDLIYTGMHNSDGYDCRKAAAAGLPQLARDARGEGCTRRLQLADWRGRARGDSWSERLRQIDADQDDYSRMLSRGSGRLVDVDFGARDLGRFSAARPVGHCFE